MGIEKEKVSLSKDEVLSMASDPLVVLKKYEGREFEVIYRLLEALDNDDSLTAEYEEIIKSKLKVE